MQINSTYIIGNVVMFYVSFILTCLHWRKIHIKTFLTCWAFHNCLLL